MLRKIAILTIVLAQVVYVQAQQIKFGVHIDPFFSFIDSDYSKIKSDGANFGVGLGVELEYRFTAEENYALTFGADFDFNHGGTLLYEYGGVLFPNSQFDNRSSFSNINGDAPPAGEPINMAAFTKINYGINYVAIPVGLKLRTNELGGTYMRAFFHIPIVRFLIPVIASARIFPPDANAAGFADDQTANKYSISQSSDPVAEPNVWSDITPIQISLGVGAGVEYSPNQDGGLRLYAGIYYQSGLIDVTNGFGANTTFSAAANPSVPVDIQERNPRNALHNIALRIGVLF